MNAAVFTDIPATIKKAGFHLDGSPKLAIAGLFDEKVDFVIDNNQAKYRSSSLSIVLADVKTDWKKLTLFFLGLAGAIASVVISVIAGQVVKDYFGYGYEHKTLFFIGILIPIITVFVKVVVISNTDGYFTRLSGIRKTRKTRLNFSVSTAVPKVPESVLSQIIGPGPFAILFEVTEGWRKIQPDPVIFRVITIDDQQFFEPVVGYDMTPLEKASLVEA